MTSPILARRTLLRASAGALLPLALPFGRALAATPDPVSVANGSGNLNQLMLQLMVQEKFLESFDLAPKLMSVADGTKVLAGIVSGDVDCSTMSGFGQAFPAIERGAPLKILAGGALPPTLAVFSAKPDIQKVTDLAGRTIGVGSLGALLHQLMIALLLKNNVDLTNIRFVNVGSSADVFRAVSAGVVDAGPGDIAALEDPDRYHVHGVTGGNMSDALPEFTFQGAWTSDHFIATKRDILVRCLAAHAKLYRFVQKPEAHDAVLSAWAAISKEAQRRDGEGLWNYVQKYKPFATDLVLSPERIAYLQQLNIQVKVQNKVLPFEQVTDMSIARDALKLL